MPTVTETELKDLTELINRRFNELEKKFDIRCNEIDKKLDIYIVRTDERLDDLNQGLADLKKQSEKQDNRL